MLTLNLVLLLSLARLVLSFRETRRSGMLREGGARIHWYSEAGDIFVTLKQDGSMFCFLEVYTKIGAEYERIRPLAKSVEEVDSNVLNLVDRNLAKLCKNSILLTTDAEWSWTNGGVRYRRLIKARRKRGRSQRKKKSVRCPVKRTPQCSVLHDFHAKHLQYHNVDAISEINKKSCRCRHNTGARIPCGTKICHTGGIYQPCGVKYCNNIAFDFCAESRIQCNPKALVADYLVKNLRRSGVI